MTPSRLGLRRAQELRPLGASGDAGCSERRRAATEETQRIRAPRPRGRRTTPWPAKPTAEHPAGRRARTRPPLGEEGEFRVEHHRNKAVTAIFVYGGPVRPSESFRLAARKQREPRTWQAAKRMTRNERLWPHGSARLNRDARPRPTDTPPRPGSAPGS